MTRSLLARLLLLPFALLLTLVARADGPTRVVWDGDTVATGSSWVAPQSPRNFLKPQSRVVHAGRTALEFHGEGRGFLGAGWNWHGFFPANAGTDLRPYRNLAFWIRVDGPTRPEQIEIALTCSAS